MKWGIVFSSTVCPDAETAAAFAENAEEAGFESLWAPEHVVIPMEYVPQYEASSTGKMDQLERSGVPDPIVWFAFVAARTKTIKFGTGVVILPEHETISYAKSVATLAKMSNGRFMLGIGVGWCKEEYDALGMPWDNRGARCEEQIDVLRTIWREPEASYNGRFYKFPPLRSDPKPPGGTVPIVVGGDSEAAARRAGRVGDGYFPAIFPTEKVWTDLPPLLNWVREGAKDAGRDPNQIELTSGGVRTAEGAKWFADQGVHRLTVAIRSKTIPTMREEMMRLSEELIEPTRDL